MNLHVQVDSLLELAAAGLAVWGLYVLAGVGAAIVTASVCAAVLAEFSFSGLRVTVPLRRRSKR